MTGPVSRTTTAPPSRAGTTETTQPANTETYPSLAEGFKPSDHLKADGSLDLSDAVMPKDYGAFISGMGESHAKSIAGRAEQKMGEWVKNNPNATKEQFTDQLKKTLMMESLVQNELKNSLQKFMNDLFGKMKEMASDRFS